LNWWFHHISVKRNQLNCLIRCPDRQKWKPSSILSNSSDIDADYSLVNLFLSNLFKLIQTIKFKVDDFRCIKRNNNLSLVWHSMSNYPSITFPKISFLKRWLYMHNSCWKYLDPRVIAHICKMDGLSLSLKQSVFRLLNFDFSLIVRILKHNGIRLISNDEVFIKLVTKFVF